MKLLTIQDVAQQIGRCDKIAGQIIRQLNAELTAQGYLTIRGKVPEAYFNERFYGGSENEKV